MVGGHSSRMGLEKAFLHLFGEEQPNLLQRTYNLLSHLVPVVWLSCRQDNVQHDFHCVVDTRPNMGPIAGVYAVLAKAKELGYAAALILSCDLPCMTHTCLERLLLARHERERNRSASKFAAGDILATTCSDYATNALEPLVAIYEVRVLPLLASAIARNERRLRRVIPEQQWQRVLLGKHEATALFNMNTVQDLKYFNKILKNKV